MIISQENARDVGMRALVFAGVPDEFAQIQMDVLIDAELRGLPSHGLLRLPRVIERIQRGVINPASAGEHVWRTDSFLRVDGCDGLGPVVAATAIDRICERASHTGIAIAAIANNNHLGVLGWYVERVAAAGQTMIALTTSEALVHPWGGRKAMLGTNPIAVGVPASPYPFVLDMATGIVSMGKIHDYAHRGKPIPDDWALDADGERTINPEAAMHGAIAPFGGAKGYALGLAFEVIVTSLTEAAIGTDVVGTLDADRRCNKGDVFIAIEPASRAVADSISAYLDLIRACPPNEPGKPVRVPGDGAHSSRMENAASGFSVADDVWSSICALAERSTAVSNAAVRRVPLT